MHNLMRRNIFLLVGLMVIQGIFLLSAPISITQDAIVLTKQEQSAFKNIAAEWVKLGEWCVSKKLGTQARLCLGRAETADAAAPKLKSFKEQAASCEDSPAEEDSKAWETKLASTGRAVAGYYDRLFNSLEQESDTKAKERADKYLIAGLELAPADSRWAAAIAAVNNSAKSKRLDRADNLAGRCLALKPPDKFIPGFKTALDSAAAAGVILKSTSSHPIRYFFSLPKDFKRVKDKKWPVLVCVDGAGSNFSGIASSYFVKRSKLPYMVVAPCTFSNTNAIEGDMLAKYQQYYPDEVIEEAKNLKLRWDEQGILAIINDLRENYDAESRVYITGFSGGGNVIYMMIFRHPDLLNGAAPACANFVPYEYLRLKDTFPADILDFPIHIFTGEKDEHREFTFGNKNSPGIDPQTNQAEALLKDFGYANYKRTMVSGMGHSAAEDQVINALKPYIEGRKKRTDKLD
ncbi:MAG: hypothetical protein V1701_11340 [Planctomycetota bacterium]